MQKITPFLWFNGKAEAAAEFYVSVFKNTRIVDVMRSGEAGPGPKGSVLTMTFEIEGQQFIALNGGPQFSFTPAISFFVACHTQEELDGLWDKLLAGGAALQCGWVTDKYGVSWQIVPAILNDLLRDKDAAKSARVMKAMLGMNKLDIAALEKAYEGR
jgi:predicted 3-demethylubiquinone-9 3-methyltransferase (glyoxalase superfamily)